MQGAPQMSPQQFSVFSKVMASMGISQQRPVLYGADNRPLAPSASYVYSRSAAKRTGSMKNWIPKRLLSRRQEAREREKIVERSIDLTNSDPHAAGLADTFATMIIGHGLTPHPLLNKDILNLDKEQARKLRGQLRGIFNVWSPFADAGGRMPFGALTYLVEHCLMKYGEYLVLLRMLDDPVRPYSLACQVINPLRLRTPVDKISEANLVDGVELGANGEPKAYWIKKADPADSMKFWSDTSENFMRITARQAHRWKVLHGFVSKDPEQVRGMPFFAPAMKYFRDLNDLLDAELVSNVVTAALAYFIETAPGGDPWTRAAEFADSSTDYYDQDNKKKSIHYKNFNPGQVMYGSPGQKPHLMSADRPGRTFEPFIKTIKKSMAMSVNMPYPVAFKDVEGVNFAGFRSAMLDAWRVVMFRRELRGADFNQPIYCMLQEEAYLRGDLQVNDFYSKRFYVCRTEWRGPPKGDIEPIKAAKANVLKNKHKHKTLSQIIAEEDGVSDLYDIVDQLEEENELLAEKGLDGGEDDGEGDGEEAASRTADAVIEGLEERE